MLKVIRAITNNNYMFSIVNKVFSILCGLITTALINRFLGPELKGEYSYIINIVNIVVVVANLGIYQSYSYYKRERVENQLSRYINIFFFQAIIYLILSIILSCFLKVNKYVVALFMIPIQVLAQQLSMVLLIEIIKFRQKLNFIMIFINLLLVVCVYSFCPQNIVFIMYVSIIKDFIDVIVYLIKIKYIPNPLNIDKVFFKQLIKFGTLPMITAILINLNYKVDIFVLKDFVSNSEIGLYSTGAALAEYAWLIPDAFKDVLFSKTAKDDSVNETVFCIKVSFFIILILFLGMILFGKIFIKMLYGNEYISSFNVTCLIFMGIPSMVLYKLIGPLFIAKGKQRFYFYVLLSSVISNIVLNFLLIPIWGKEGAAIASIISYSISGIPFYIRFINEYNIRWYQPLIIENNDVKKLKKIIEGIKL